MSLDLAHNGLRGRVRDTSELLPHLAVREGLGSVRSIKLAGNSLYARMPPELTSFLDERCSTSFDEVCSGLPPFSCTAFGGRARMSISEASVCYPCDEGLGPTIALVGATIFVLLLVFLLYVVIILRYPDALRRWVSYFIILVNHTQTLSILGAIDFAWPPSVLFILRALSLFQIESTSCLFPQGVPSFWLYVYVMLATSLLLLGGTILAIMASRLRGRKLTASRLEFLLSVLYSLLFVYSIRVCATSIRSRGAIAAQANYLAAPCLVIILALFDHCWSNVQAWRRGLAGEGWVSPGRCSSGKPVDPRSLKMHVYYLTHRFARHAPRWQFVIWARQFALIVITEIPAAISVRWPTAVGPWTRYPAAVACMLVFLVAFAVHIEYEPYAFRTQNAMETALLLANLLLLTFACTFQTLVDQS